MSSLMATSDRSSRGLSGRVSGPSFSGSFCGVSWVLLAISLHRRHRATGSRSCRVADSLKGGCAYLKLICKRILSVSDANAPEITKFHRLEGFEKAQPRPHDRIR